MEDPDRLTRRPLAARARCRECGDWIEAGALALVGRNMTYCLAVQDCADQSLLSKSRSAAVTPPVEDGRSLG